ncbi:MAG: MBOAT family O-acyltransferase [Bacteroidota bacterium]
MLFSSLVFLFIFLPIILIGNSLIPSQYRNGFLLIGSLIFFAWGGVSLSILLLISIVINYCCGRLLFQFLDSPKHAKWILGVGIGINLTILATFKYADFFISNLNILGEYVQLSPIAKPNLALPIGISFYTFQAISYLIDLYRREVQVQKNVFRLALYISLFPQLIAGPIVRYKDLEFSLKSRVITTEDQIKGIQRFLLGLAKKILLANQFALVADAAFSSSTDELLSYQAWIGLFAFAMQIYYDFSGYSDMAIGLGRLLGFHFPENFDFPYLAQSVRHFWRRWHISLSSWFRDYVYIPLGGNQRRANRVLFNLLLVFFLTGFWHGASWNFVIWGLVHGCFMLLERGRWGRVLNGLPAWTKSVYTLGVVWMSWVMFRADNFLHAYLYVSKLFVWESSSSYSEIDSYIFHPAFLLVSLFGIAGAFGVFPYLEQRLISILKSFKLSDDMMNNLATLSLYILVPIVLGICTMFLAVNSYNAFIYFRF